MPDPISAMEGAEDAEAAEAALLLSMRGIGIRQLVDGKTEAYPLPGSQRLFRLIRLFRDRNGGLWIGTTDQGLLHVHQGRTDQFARSDGLSGDFVKASLRIVKAIFGSSPAMASTDSATSPPQRFP
jgi:ligand-binding sensor domain-containing protein